MLDSQVEDLCMFVYPRNISATEVVVGNREGNQINQGLLGRMDLSRGIRQQSITRDVRHFVTFPICLNYRDEETTWQRNTRRRDLYVS